MVVHLRWLPPIVAASLLLSGCNAGALVLGAMAQRVLSPTTISGTLTNPPATVKIGHLAWIELLNDGNVKGQLNFDLVANKTVRFDQTTTPSGAQFSMALAPSADVAEGTYVVIAWDDTNGNSVYDGDQNERRAQEVYRVRGQAANRSLWTTEKFVFTATKLEIQYANHEGGLAFSF